MEKVILRNSGLPFATKRAAELRIGALAKEGKAYTAIPWSVDDPDNEGKSIEGWALERVENGRRMERIPVGTRNRLTAPKRPGYVRRWVNNQPGRIQMFEQAGYTQVTDKDYDPANPGVVRVGDMVGNRPAPMGSSVIEEVGGGNRAVLMEIRKDWYDEDQEAKSRKLDEMEAQIKRRPNKDGFYGNISVDGTGRSKKRSAVHDYDEGHFD